MEYVENKNCLYAKRTYSILAGSGERGGTICIKKIMASLLALNDDCLHRIVSCLVDPGSFYNISLTCKRLLQVTKSTRNVIHSKLLQLKAEYYIKSYLVHITNTSGERAERARRSDDYDKYCRLGDLLHDSARLTAAKGTLSYPKVIDVWQQNGPVVAKLFTWIANRETRVKEGSPRATCITQYRIVTLRLPGCDKNMEITTKYFHDYIGNYDNELGIHVNCGDLDVISEGKLKYYNNISLRISLRKLISGCRSLVSRLR